jgi:hypothetical protein
MNPTAEDDGARTEPIDSPEQDVLTLDNDDYLPNPTPE